MPQDAGVPQHFNKILAGCISNPVIDMSKAVRTDKGIQVGCKFAMRVAEERPVQMLTPGAKRLS
jgi:hypothetical protein